MRGRPRVMAGICARRWERSRSASEASGTASRTRGSGERTYSTFERLPGAPPTRNAGWPGIRGQARHWPDSREECTAAGSRSGPSSYGTRAAPLLLAVICVPASTIPVLSGASVPLTAYFGARVRPASDPSERRVLRPRISSRGADFLARFRVACNGRRPSPRRVERDDRRDSFSEGGNALPPAGDQLAALARQEVEDALLAGLSEVDLGPGAESEVAGASVHADALSSWSASARERETRPDRASRMLSDPRSRTPAGGRLE